MSRVSLFAKPVWTPPEDEQLRELSESGESVATIAAKLERSEKAIRERAAKLGLKEGIMSKKTVIKKLTETLDDMVAAAPAEPMTAREIATAKAKKKAKGAADKRAAKTAAKKTAPKKKVKKSKR